MASTAVIPENKELVALRVAREIAMGIHGIETILQNNNLSADDFAQLKDNRYFQDLLTSQISEWESALNTHERVKVKSAALVELWLEEANVRAHDRTEPLNAKVELMKLIRGLAGIGANGTVEGGGAGEKFSITINLGADSKLTFQKEVTSPVIEGETTVVDT